MEFRKNNTTILLLLSKSNICKVIITKDYVVMYTLPNKTFQKTIFLHYGILTNCIKTILIYKTKLRTVADGHFHALLGELKHISPPSQLRNCSCDENNDNNYICMLR